MFIKNYLNAMPRCAKLNKLLAKENRVSLPHAKREPRLAVSCRDLQEEELQWKLQGNTTARQDEFIVCLDSDIVVFISFLTVLVMTYVRSLLKELHT